MSKNTRQLPIAEAQIRLREAAEGEQSRTVEGYGAVFGVRSVNLCPWSSSREVYEVMEPGCIDADLIKRSDVVFNYCHDNSAILGRSRNGEGTLKLSVDEKGLRYQCDLPNTEQANAILEGIKRGDIYGNSFCFTDDEEDTENGVSYERMAEKSADGKEVWLRHVKRCTGLYDVSIVVTPAYPDAEISQRELGEKAEKQIDAIIKREADNAASETSTAEQEAAAAAEREAHAARVAYMNNETDIMELEGGM